MGPLITSVSARLDDLTAALRRDRLFGLCVLGGLFVLATGVVFNDRPGNDVASCYAPQVREFAAGNWTGAFFHMTPPLVIVLAGLVATLGIPAFGALKLVSALAFLAGLWPLARLLERLLPREYVSWGCVLYIASPRLLRYATAGTLETAKLFFLLWGIVLLLDCVCRPGWRPWVSLAVCLAGLSLSRADGVFFLPFFVAGVILLTLWEPWRRTAAGTSTTTVAERGGGADHSADTPPAGARGGSKQTFASERSGNLLRSLRRVSGRVLVLLAFFLLLCLPQMWYIFKITGSPALDSRQTMRIQQLLGSVEEGSSPVTTIWFPPKEALSLRPVAAADRFTPWRSVRETFKGLDMFWLGLAAIGLALRIRQRDWSREETVFVAIVLYNVALFAANGFITKRYTATTAPFLLVWAVPGAVFLRQVILTRIHRHAFSLVVAIVVLAGAWSGLAKVRAAVTGKPNPERRFGTWVMQNRDRLLQPDTAKLVSDPVLPEYHNGRRPIVAAATPQFAFWAAGDWVSIDSGYLHPLASVVRTLAACRVEVVAVDEEFRVICPEFTGQLPGFAPLTNLPATAGFQVYGRTAGAVK